MKRKYINFYVDGIYIVEVIQAALDNNLMVADLKKTLLNANQGKKCEFKVETKKH